MGSFFDWNRSEDKQDVVHLIVQALVEGKLVALPAETAYHVFASGLDVGAVATISDLRQQGRVGPPSCFLRSPEEALDFSPLRSRVAERVVRRGWPGPLVLELPTNGGGSLAERLPAEVQSAVLHAGRFLAMRVASHEAIQHALRLMPGPLVAAPILGDGSAPVCADDGLEAAIGDAAALVVGDGKTHYGGLATSVRIDGNQCLVREDGVINSATLDQLFQLVVLLVCTGNTCRSPMAETILTDLLKNQFPQWMDAERPMAFVGSAGLSAFPGGPASAEAQAVMRSRGLSLQNHQSRSVTERSLKLADFVFTMTASHRAAILERLPHLSQKVQLLSGSGEDVSDPYGGSESVYAACADQIEGYLKQWVAQLDETWFPTWVTKLT